MPGWWSGRRPGPRGLGERFWPLTAAGPPHSNRRRDRRSLPALVRCTLPTCYAVDPLDGPWVEDDTNVTRVTWFVSTNLGPLENPYEKNIHPTPVGRRRGRPGVGAGDDRLRR